MIDLLAKLETDGKEALPIKSYSKTTSLNILLQGNIVIGYAISLKKSQGRSETFLSWCCDVIVFKKFRFYRAHENTKTGFRKFSLWKAFSEKLRFPVTVFTGYMRTEGQSVKKVVFLNENGFA